ncbi:MAG: helix-turn-helix domain-containing protein [Lachnospiraceae bacterium]|nr:helix-turn-helix domain-containing protein [Lachnospiraceae bacterium]
MKITIAYRIKTLREYKNLTQEELAEKAGYHDKSSISKIENSGDNISLKKVNKIAAALDVSPAKLLGDDETDTRIQVLADAAEKDREKIPQELKDSLDKFDRLLKDYKKDLDQTRALVNELKRRSEYKELGETFDDAMDQIESKSNILDSLFVKLENAINYIPSAGDIPDGPEATGDRGETGITQPD